MPVLNGFRIGYRCTAVLAYSVFPGKGFSALFAHAEMPLNFALRFIKVQDDKKERKYA